MDPDPILDVRIKIQPKKVHIQMDPDPSKVAESSPNKCDGSGSDQKGTDPNPQHWFGELSATFDGKVNIK
jgi:hypothetical protein